MSIVKKYFSSTASPSQEAGGEKCLPPTFSARGNDDIGTTHRQDDQGRLTN